MMPHSPARELLPSPLCPGDDAGGLPCTSLVCGDAGERVRGLAGELRGAVEKLGRQLAAAEPRGAAWSGDDARRFLSAASAPPAEMAVQLLELGGSWSRRGMALHAATSRLHALSEVCLAELDHVRGSPDAEVRLQAREAMDRLGRVALTLVTCAFVRALQPGTPREEPEACTARRERLCGLVGASAPMQKLYARIELAAASRDTVLLVGESGTGKELVARAIHALSGDPPTRLVAVNCAALPRELMESELFGYRRGAFSGAQTSHEGLVRAAAGGTLLLDEIGELTPEAQAKLLRVLQEHAVRGVGETHETPVAVRIVAATNERPEALLRGGRLRRDLYYRLQRTVVDVPPLRARLVDVPLLARHFVASWREATGGGARELSDASLERLALHPWPGNVRELENAIHAACSASPGPWVRLSDLPPLELLGAPALEEPSQGAPRSLKDAERLAIVEAMRQTRGNKSMASRVLGISRKQLYVKLREHGVAGGPGDTA